MQSDLCPDCRVSPCYCDTVVEYLDDVVETDIYGNAIRPAEWSGADEDFDGEALIDNLLSGDTE